MFDWSSALQVGSGIAGIMGGSSANSAANEYYGQAAKLMKARANATKRALDVAEAYNPDQEAADSAQYATDTASDTLGKSLKGLNQEFLNSGGSAGGDTAFRVKAQGATNRVVDPLKQWLATQKSQSTAKKINALAMAVGSGGDIADEYMKLGNTYQSQANTGGSYGMLSAGLSGLLGGKKNQDQKKN